MQVPKGSHLANKKTKKWVQPKEQGTTEGCLGLAHRTVRCTTGLSGAPPDSVRCTREPNSELLTFGKSGSRSAIIHRTVRCASGATATSRQRSSAESS